MHVGLAREDPMDLYVVEYEPGGRGCPPVLKGRLNHAWEWDEFDPEPAKFEIKNEYVYESKNPIVDFDYWNQNWLASRKFVDLCMAYGARIRLVPVMIIQSDKKRTQKDYFYPLWEDWLSIIDFERSDIDFDRDLETGEVIMDRYFTEVPRCSAIRKFVVDPAKLDERQVFKCIDLDSELVCTEDFRAKCEASGLVGVKFTPLRQR